MASPAPSASHRAFARRLTKLLGTWTVEGGQPVFDPPVRGTSTIKWLVKGGLVEVRTRVKGIPASVSIIGVDDVNDTFTMLYADDRPVLRRYEMTLTARRWTISRRAPGFSQRFIANISANGQKITGRWEKSADARRWELDFHLVYTKRKGRKR